MKKTFSLCLVIFSCYWYCSAQHFATAAEFSPAALTQSQSGADAVIADAFARRKSNIQVTGEGTVVKLLKDDNDGSRHQKFIVSLRSGQTVLIAHNIDLAPRIDAIQRGDNIQFSGEYEWSHKGGVIHWTHRDPRGKHLAGWLKHNGKVYQ